MKTPPPTYFCLSHLVRGPKGPSTAKSTVPLSGANLKSENTLFWY